jgi:PEP-CTERM motif
MYNARYFIKISIINKKNAKFWPILIPWFRLYGSFNVSLSGDSKTLYLNYARAIPEPSTGGLLLLGLGGVAWLRGRHRRTPVSSSGI